MSPLPVGNSRTIQAGGKPLLPLPTAFPVTEPIPAKTNRPRHADTPGSRPHQRAYPFLLLASTSLAGVFCYLYLTKPVIASTAASPAPGPMVTVAKPAVAAAKSQPAAGTKPAGLLPASDHLPGDTKPSATPLAGTIPPGKAAPGSRSIPAFEETNLRIQHVLNAESPGGGLSRLVLDVPVLYKTGNLAWTESQVAESRELLESLTVYQEKTRELREEGSRLLAAWKRLLGQSVPAPVLRADSPSLPDNQNSGNMPATPPEIDTTRSIQLQSAGK